MISKTLDNQEGTRKLHIESAGGGFVTLKLEFAGREEYFTVSSDSIPSISLALLEAAGFEDSSTGGHITGARIAVGDLKRHVKMQERATAEAKDKAKLEAEALELYRTFYGTDVLWVDVFKKETWLAVARRARELSGRVEK